MIKFEYENFNCQNPLDKWNINRVYTLIKCTFNNTGDNKAYIQKKALELAVAVNPHRANDATTQRGKERLIKDAIGGVLAEHGWLYYINTFYNSIASFTSFNGANGQIDIILSNGKTIEIRSSFPRNGVKFAVCNNKFNFRNICKYENFYKPSEINKDFFGSVLFETSKNDILDSDEVIFYLIGGSTREMMNSYLCYTSDLTAEDDLTQTKTKYRVINLKDALDILGFEGYLNSLGYKKVVAN